MRIWLLIIFVFLLSVGSSFALSPVAGPFSDVSVDHINNEAISFVKENGIVSGYPDGRFGPEDLVNRAAFTKIIVAASHDGDIKGGSCFSDVQNEWFAPYVCFAKRNAIVAGIDEDTFAPSETISFAAASKIIVKAFGFESGSDDIWYKPYVELLSSKSAIPMSIRRFDQKLTRAQMAEIIYRVRSGKNDKDSQSYATLDYHSQQSEDVVVVESDIAWKDYYSQFFDLHFKYPPHWFVLKGVEGKLYIQNRKEPLTQVETTPGIYAIELRPIVEAIDIDDFVFESANKSNVRKERLYMNGIKIHHFTYELKGLGMSSEAVWEKDNQYFGARFFFTGEDRSDAVNSLRLFLSTFHRS